MRRIATRCTSATCSTATASGARLGAPKRLAYGSKPVEQLDLFPTSNPNAPINVFIHGGAWRTRSVKDYAFLAEIIVRAGGHWVGLDFDGVEGTKGDLLPMADQVRRGVAWVYKNAKSFGGDPNRIYVSGQSSGAHLAGVHRDHRLEGLRRACRHREGCVALLRHV